MSFSDIFLIIISSAGLLHGLLCAIYLCFLKKKKTLPNLLMGLILIFMAFRIGKSVMKNFGEGLEPVFIFMGLAFLLLIGPLLKRYVQAMTQVNFKLQKKNFLEFTPFFLAVLASLYITIEPVEGKQSGYYSLCDGSDFYLSAFCNLYFHGLEKHKTTHQDR